VQAVIRLLLLNGSAIDRIKIAVVNTTLHSHVVDPDYLCFEQKIVSFPWSRDSLERKKYSQLYRGCPQSLKALGSTVD
jgi:hypothetical protein